MICYDPNIEYWEGFFMFRILLAEDDPSQRKIMSTFLKMNQYEVYAVEDGLAALRALEDVKVDLAILDVMMPGMDGFELTRQLRSYEKALPILIVTAKGDFSDKQIGFLAGTDDYMVKPVDLDELNLRVKALLRRASIQSEHKITIGETELDDSEWTVMAGGEKLTLPRKEFELLFMLLSYPGKLLTRRQLMDEVWGVECDTDERTVDVHIKRLREKLKDNPDFEIMTIRGLGYRAEVKHA